MTAGPSKRKIEDFQVESKPATERKKRSIVKKDVIQDHIHKLIVDSEAVHGNIDGIEESLMKLFKEMIVKQSDILASMYGLVEEYEYVFLSYSLFLHLRYVYLHHKYFLFYIHNSLISFSGIL